MSDKSRREGLLDELRMNVNGVQDYKVASIENISNGIVALSQSRPDGRCQVSNLQPVNTRNVILLKDTDINNTGIPLDLINSGYEPPFFITLE